MTQYLLFFETKDGSVWIGSFSGGLNRWNNGTFTQYTTHDGLASSVVCTLFEDSKGVLWIGTINGLNRYVNGKFQQFTTKDGLANNVIYSVFEDREGALWIGSREGGLNRYRNGNFQRFTTHEGLSNDFVYTIIQTDDGAVWIGTKGGLFRFENEKFTHFSTQNGLSHNFITALYEDSDKTLWIGTSGGGLIRYKNRKFSVINSDDGLFDDVVYSMLEDGSGNAWMTSNKGIFRIRMKDLNDFADGNIKSISGISYGKADGMRLSECNSGQSVSLKTRDGKLWFATLKGAVVVDPDRIPINKIPPNVMIEKMIIDGQFARAQNNVLQIPPGKLKFEFQYTGLSFFAPDKVLFKYKLEGLDREWVTAGTRRVAYYSNLNRGQYKFRVLACNNDGFWNQNGDSIAFELQPYFYQTGWFYALCGILAIFCGIVAHRLRLRHVQARFQTILAERTRIARDLHDTLAQSLSGMIAQIDAADEVFNKDSSKSHQYLQRIRNLAQQGLDETRQAVWKLRPESKQSKDLQQSLMEIANRFSRNDVIIRINVEGKLRQISELVRENLLRIAQQAISNAIQHSSPKSIQVLLLFEPQSLVLRIQDDGCGFDPSLQKFEGEHFGLKGMQERAAQIDGKFNIISKVGEGTQVIVQVPY